MKILDCTLRDGGYYTNWDYSDEISDTYIEALNLLPIDYIEIGYRSLLTNKYRGKFFYCPEYVLQEIREKSNKKLAVMVNEKSVNMTSAISLLSPIKGVIDTVRIAVSPEYFSRGLKLAEEVKAMGFEVGFNVMHMSTWNKSKSFLNQIKEVNGIVDYFYMVDSYGGVYPNDVKSSYELIREKTDVCIGFHGHNNLEMAFINTLTAIKCGVDIVDATVTGIGRGAGNLKLELLLTAMEQKGEIEFDFNPLGDVVAIFSELQKSYQWGTSLPYMVAGANSLPSQNVMEWVGKRYYSFNSILRTLENQTKGIEDNIKLEGFKPKFKAEKVLIIGGGPTGSEHEIAIRRFLSKDLDIVVIHVSSKNVKAYQKIVNNQVHCLVGNEGHRLESTFETMTSDNRVAILPPYPRAMGTYIPKIFEHKVFELKNISFTNIFKDSVTAIAIQVAIDLDASEIFFTGYDGYNELVSQNELELFYENQELFSMLNKMEINVSSLTPTKYSDLKVSSLYASI